ncbi:hypothetical protein [Phaeobacter sp. SYSU ZJ3003]|uniref:hypothetical protein n=1 Tax=Phaeobacter sp. SYSU ZJ3003 TaxID=2109330 RepID=UPI00351C05A4
MQNPRYVTADHGSICLDLPDGTLRVVDRDGPTDLFARAEAGAFGPVAAFDATLEVTAVPGRTVSRLQAKAALLQMGLLDQVDALVGNLDQMTRLAWAEATSFRRDSPLLNALVTHVLWPDGAPLTGADLDALFDLAETIEV